MNDTPPTSDGGVNTRAQKPIVQSTVVQPAAAPVASFDQWGAIVYVMGGVIALVMLASGVISIVDRIMAWRKQGESEDRGELDEVRSQVKELQVTSKDFMPRREIEKGFAHERENRITGEKASVERFERMEQRIVSGERAQTRLETQVAGQSETLARIERSMEAMATRFDDKLDRIAASVGKA